MYRKYNPNPRGRKTTDCVIRAIAKAFDWTWERAYVEVCQQGLRLKDMPNANHVWGMFLEEHGFLRRMIPYTCPDCYTVKDFCRDHPLGLYIVCTGTHVVTVIDGDWYDAWDSGNEAATFYFWR